MDRPAYTIMKDERLNNLTNAILSSKSDAIKKLKVILLYLKEKTYEADINELKNV